MSLVPHMTLIRPNTLPIKGAMTLFWIKPFYKCIVMPLFRIIPKFWDDFVYWKLPVCLDMSLFRINTLTKWRVMPLITPNTQPKCATITLFPHMPLFRHQRVIFGSMVSFICLSNFLESGNYPIYFSKIEELFCKKLENWKNILPKKMKNWSWKPSNFQNID